MVENNKSIGRVTFLVLNTLFMIFIAVVCILPVWHVFAASFSNASYVLQQSGIIWRIQGFDLGGYNLIFKNVSLWSGYLNTIIYVVATVGLGLLVSLLLAYTVSRRNALWNNWIMLLMTITLLFNGGLIASYIVNTQLLGLYNNRLAIILPACFSVFNVILLRTAIMGVPDSLEESAKIDGAGQMMVLFRIIIPLITPTIATVVLFAVLGNWNSWFSASIYLRDRNLFPLQLILREIIVANNVSSIITSSAAEYDGSIVMYKELVKYCVIVISTLPILVVYPFLQKYFEKGVMIGALKG